MRVALRPMLLLLVLSFVANTSALADRVTEQLKPSLPDKATDRDLMKIYGAIIRANYRNGTTLGEDTPAFLSLEQELQKRRLITGKTVREIQQGIVYLKMSIVQLFATLDNLQRVEVVRFDKFTLKLFRGAVKPYRPWRDERSYRELALVCNDRLIGLVVDGRTTLDTHSGTEYTQRRVRTNFPPGFFKPSSPEMLKWIRSGRSPPKQSKHEPFAAGGHHGVFLSRIFGTEKPRAYVTLRADIEQAIANRRYPSLVSYLERSC
jgi:hypothetical protein